MIADIARAGDVVAGDQGADISVAVILAGVDSDLTIGQVLMVDGGMIRN